MWGARGWPTRSFLSEHLFDLWPQFRSPLVWDAFAIGAYATVSLLFWFVGLIPDLAAIRNRAENRWLRYIYGIFALRRGAAHRWQRYDTAYMLLAALATPLVVSVHSVVSFDFAVGVIPGWHSTISRPTLWLAPSSPALPW